MEQQPGEISLRELVDVQIQDLSQQVSALSALTDAKFVTFRTLIDSQAEKVALALTAADKAVMKSETATEKRFEGVNEFREQLRDQAATLASRREVESGEAALNAQIEVLRGRLTEITRRMDMKEGQSKGVSSSLAAIVTAIGATATLVGLIAFIITRASG